MPDHERPEVTAPAYSIRLGDIKCQDPNCPDRREGRNHAHLPGHPTGSRSSDPDLLDAFRKQCRTFGPGQALLAWQGQPGVDPDDLIDIFKEEDQRAAGNLDLLAEGHYDPEDTDA